MATATVIVAIGVLIGREAYHRLDCGIDCSSLGLVFAMYLSENEGDFYPELSNEPGRLMFAASESSESKSLYPDFMYYPGLLLCPSDPNSPPVGDPDPSKNPEWFIDDHSRFYLGYTVMNDQEVAAFAKAYRAHLSTGAPFTEDLPVPAGTGAAGGDTIFRLQEGIERFYITDTPNVVAPRVRGKIPIMIERPENHFPPGGWVIYMDGHANFISYPGKWPMTEKTIGILNSLDTLSQ